VSTIPRVRNANMSGSCRSFKKSPSPIWEA
jgi:hypothetical protein